MAQLDGTTGGQEVAGWGGATALTPYVEGGAAGALRMPAPRVSSTLPSPLACFCYYFQQLVAGNVLRLSTVMPHSDGADWPFSQPPYV